MCLDTVEAANATSSTSWHRHARWPRNANNNRSLVSSERALVIA